MSAICPSCVEGVVLSGEPTGSIRTELQGAYFAPAPELGGEPSKFAVVYLTDAFGLELKNSKILADLLAKKLGCDVWVPDYFNGTPLIPGGKMAVPEPDRAGLRYSTWDWVKLFFKVILWRIPVFIRNRQSVVLQRSISFITLLKEKKKYEKIGTVGYCFGGSIGVGLGGSGIVDTTIIVHPGSVTVQQANAIKVPSLWLCAEDDMFFSVQSRDNAEATLAARKGKENFTEYEFKIYKGTAHGFGCRPNLEIPEVKAAFESSFEDTVNWFKKTIAS